MAESKESCKGFKNVNCDEAVEFKYDITKNGSVNGIVESVEKKEVIPKFGNSIVTQEKNKILQTTIELQEIIINILKQKIKLSHILNKTFTNGLSNAVEDVQKAADESVRIFLNNSGKDISEFKVIMEFLNNVKIEQDKDFIVNVDKFLEECQIHFIKYVETFIKSKSILINVLKNVEKVLKINILPRKCELQERVLFSIFEEKLLSHYRILAASEKAFNEFESQIKIHLNIPQQDIAKTMDILLSTLNMAEIAFTGLKLLAVEALKIEYADV